MTIRFSATENNAIPLPITEVSRQLAGKFAAQQFNSEKAERVLLNTLAVAVVNNYLNMLDVATDLANSDSWNPVMRICNDVADLNLPGVGKLECRPIKSTATSCQIPLEVWDSRLGYVVVRIDDSLRQAAILGFIEEVTTENLAIAKLEPPEALIERLHRLPKPIFNKSLVNLGRWSEGIFDRGWQAVGNLLTPEQLTPALGFRSIELTKPTKTELRVANHRVSRAKLFNLGLQLGDRQIILLIELSWEEDGSTAVALQVHPQLKDLYLPEGIKLRVLESLDVTFMEAQARKRDNYIQLQFSGQPGEIFTVEIILDDIKFSERFKL